MKYLGFSTIPAVLSGAALAHSDRVPHVHGHDITALVAVTAVVLLVLALRAARK